ncbi:MAG: SRPBCC family protein [Kineosporiaceae bacterium]
MSVTTIPPVLQSVVVPLAPEQAFDLFTARFGTWWPASHSVSPKGMAECVLESGEGGRWYELDADGGRCDWGSVLAWEPPARLVLAWGLQADYSFDADLEHSSEVEVTFVPVDGGTRVDLEHRHFARHGDGAAGVHGSVSSEGGWPLLLDLFRAQAG